MHLPLLLLLPILLHFFYKLLFLHFFWMQCDSFLNQLWQLIYCQAEMSAKRGKIKMILLSSELKYKKSLKKSQQKLWLKPSKWPEKQIVCNFCLIAIWKMSKKIYWAKRNGEKSLDQTRKRKIRCPIKDSVLYITNYNCMEDFGNRNTYEILGRVIISKCCEW